MGLKACRSCDQIIGTIEGKACPHCGDEDPHAAGPPEKASPAPSVAPDREAGYTLFSDASDTILAECGKCGRVVKISRAGAKRSHGGYILPNVVRCPCGCAGARVSEKGGRRSTPGRVRCPKCRSEQVTGGKKGFGLGKAAAGGIALGPVGLLAGLVGSQKVKVSCLNCGHAWYPGGR